MARPTLAPAPEQVIVRTPTPEKKVNTSKKWELPPRPKPGRKPKPKATKCSGHSFKHGGMAGSEGQRSGCSSGHGDDHCGICTPDSGGCICAEVGLRPAPPQEYNPANTLPTPGSDTKEIDFSNFDFKTAVPLNRVSKSRNLGPKFAKLPEVQPPTLDLPETRCGFCTDQTPCVCTGEGLHKEPSPEPKKLNAHTSSAAPDDSQKDPFAVLFCLSLDACEPVSTGTPTITDQAAYQTLKLHPKYGQSDLGELITHLRASNNRVGVQSVNEALQYLNTL